MLNASRVEGNFVFEDPGILGVVLVAWASMPNGGFPRPFWGFDERINGLTVGRDRWRADCRTIDGERGVVLHVARGEYGGERSAESWWFSEDYLRNMEASVAPVPVRV